MSKEKIIIVHGAYGYPEENWFAWLERELALRGFSCKVPQFPTPARQTVNNWLKVVRKQIDDLDSNTILVGHSLGAAFILRWLEHESVRVKACVLVGAFIGAVGVKRFDSINRNFFLKPFDWPAIRERSAEFVGYYGTDDPYVSITHFSWLMQQLRAKKIILSKGGHLNQAAGYRQFPQLLLRLQQIREKS